MAEPTGAGITRLINSGIDDPLLQPTLKDWQKATDMNGNIIALIEILNQTNEIKMEECIVEGNQKSSNLTSVRTGLTKAQMVQLGERVKSSVSSRDYIQETTATAKAYHKVNYDLYRKYGAGNAWRMQEAMAEIEVMQQLYARNLFYGNSITNAAEIRGLSARYNDMTAPNGRRNIVSGHSWGDGSQDSSTAVPAQTNLRSIWLVFWGTNTCCTFFPRGSQAGLRIDADETPTVSDIEAGITKYIYTEFEQEWGLMIPDWRSVGRIPNISLNYITADAASGPNLPFLMKRLLRRIPKSIRNSARPAWYMSAEVWEVLELQLAAAVQQSTLLPDQVGGLMGMDSYLGIPIRQVDQLETRETVVGGYPAAPRESSSTN